MPDFQIEQKFDHPVIGIDEVGRGPLAGPVVSCACIFFDNSLNNQELYFIDDSKKISKKKMKLAIKEIYK